MRKITVIDGHPDRNSAHLIHALADAYVQASRAGGNDVRQIRIAELDIPVLRDPQEFISGTPPPAAADAQRDIAWADHVVFFFPLWHGSMPAALTAFIEQTFRPGFALEYAGERRLPKPLLARKSARVVVTMGMPAFVYRGYFGAYGVNAFVRSVLELAGMGPNATTLLGGVNEHMDAKAARWMVEMQLLAERDGAAAPPERRPLPAFVKRTAALAGAAAGIAAWRALARRR